MEKYMLENKFDLKTLYYKYELDKDWSVRFHFIYKDKKKCQNQWILKSHKLKEHILITKQIAIEYIEKYNSTPRLIMGFYHNHKYKKVEVTDEGELFFYIDKDRGPNT